MTHIGESIPRIEATDKVTGNARYASDFNLDRQVYIKILFAGRPHAIIKSIDTQAAEQMEGVLMVLTAKDVPVNEFGYYIPDQPVLCGPGSTKEYADRVRFPGDKVSNRRG
jgi:CO/xanthine dehydrogenase Mo-binding subunit